MPSVFDTEGTARESLREIVADYGVAALDDERLITSLLTDLLAGHPREATLIRAAARVRVAELLRTHAANRIPVGTAIEDVGARLGHEGLIEASAARWIVTEYAVALGQVGPDGSSVGRIPAQGVARVAPPEPAPTVYDPSPVSDPRPVSGEPDSRAGRADDSRSSDPRSSDPRPVGPDTVQVGATTAAPTVAGPPAAGPPPPAALPTVADIAIASSRPTTSPRPAAGAPAAFTRPPILATVLALALPPVLGITLILSVPATVNPNTYADALNDQWAMILLPMTLTLIAVTAATRAGRRAWLATAGYAVGVYLATVGFPAIGDSDSGAPLFQDIHLASLRLSLMGRGAAGDLWLLFISVGLTALAHAVMKRLGLVRRVGLLAYLLTPAIVLLTNAVGVSGYAYVSLALHNVTTNDVTDGLIGLAVTANLACVMAVGLAFVPRIGGRR